MALIALRVEIRDSYTGSPAYNTQSAERWARTPEIENDHAPPALCAFPGESLAILELCVRATRPKHRSILDALSQHPGVTDMAEIQTLHRFAYWSDLDQCLENTQLSSTDFRRAEAKKRAVLTLSSDEG